jgi:hypothetical protein
MKRRAAGKKTRAEYLAAGQIQDAAMEGRRYQPAHLVPPKGRGTGPAPPPLIPMWHRCGPTRLSKAAPDLCQLTDSKIWPSESLPTEQRATHQHR